MNAKSDNRENGVPKLILFVTGQAPRSRRARRNLREALDGMGLDQIHPMEVDLLTHPQETITYSVFATPALLRTSELGEVSVLYGDLTDETALRGFLGDIPE